MPKKKNIIFFPLVSFFEIPLSCVTRDFGRVSLYNTYMSGTNGSMTSCGLSGRTGDSQEALPTPPQPPTPALGSTSTFWPFIWGLGGWGWAGSLVTFISEWTQSHSLMPSHFLSVRYTIQEEMLQNAPKHWYPNFSSHFKESFFPYL